MESSTSDIYYHGPVVVFDLDDTLFSEREFAVGAYRRVAMMPDVASPWLSPKIIATMTAALDRGDNPFDALERFLAGNRVGHIATIRQRVDVYRRHRPRHLTLYHDARLLLDALRDAGIRTSIVTDGRTATQLTKLRALGIAERFNPADIFISEATSHDKSTPDNFAAVVHRYPEASRFIYIGDNPAKDFTMPSLLGWETYCLLDRGHNIHPQLSLDAATKCVKELTEIIPEIIDK